MPIHPYRDGVGLNEFLADNTIYIGDGGDVVTISAQAVRPRGPRAMEDTGAPATWGRHRLAIAAGLANPSKRVSDTTGDAFVRHDRLRHGDGPTARRPVSRGIGNNSAMNQIVTGQLENMASSAANVGNLLGDFPSAVCGNVGRLRRRSARPGKSHRLERERER